MKAIYKLPGQEPEVIDVDNTLEAIQEKVDGYIEVVTIFSDVCAICNEEGRIRGMEHNVNLLGVDFCGPILLVGFKGDEFTDLNDTAENMLMAYLGRASHGKA